MQNFFYNIARGHYQHTKSDTLSRPINYEIFFEGKKVFYYVGTEIDI